MRHKNTSGQDWFLSSYGYTAFLPRLLRKLLVVMLYRALILEKYCDSHLTIQMLCKWHHLWERNLAELVTVRLFVCMLFTPQPSLPEGNGWMDVMFRALWFLPTVIVGVSTFACIAETKQETRLQMLKFQMLFFANCSWPVDKADTRS